MTVTADTRTAVFDAVRAGVGAVGMPAERVHRVLPLDVATPCCYLEVATRRTDADNGAITVDIPIVIVVDGADAAQVAALDELGDAVWDAVAAATAGMVTIGDYTEPVDVGGPRLRSLTVTASVDVYTATLCPRTLTRELAHV